MNWVKFGDRAPENLSTVLCIGPDGDYFVAEYKLSKVNFSSEPFDPLEGDIVYWMPLPSPPKDMTEYENNLLKENK